MYPLVTLTTDSAIAVIVIDNPPVNALSQPVRQQLLACLQQAQADPQVQAIVIACQGKTFVAGADLNEFDSPLAPPHLPDVLRQIEDRHTPVMAALHGAVLGGGLELALACHWRIADIDTRLGLPEVSLGLIPGAGGTQRLVRLCGPALAVDLVIAGTRLSALQAQAAGLIDEVAPGDVRTVALDRARQWLAEKQAWSRTRDLPVPAYDSVQVEQKLVALLHKRAGEQAPQAARRAIEAASSLPFEQGMALERSLFIDLRQSAQARALRHVFFAERGLNSRIRKLTGSGPALKVQQVAVIGAGTMGSGIAICLANAGLDVRLIDVQAGALARGVLTIDDHYQAAVLKGRIDAGHAAACRALIQASERLDDVREADLVIEAVFEDMAVKREVFRTLDALCRADAILATNTSYLDVEAIADCTGRPGRVLGMHFFSPAPVMKLLEVVRTSVTDRQVLTAVLQLGQRLGKVSVAVGVCDGFVGNRLLAAREREAMFLLEEGAEPEQVDRVMRNFGFPLGPFELRDLAGVDVAWRNRQGRLARLSERERRCDWVDLLYAAGRLGQKTGQGFYRYEAGSRRALPDAWLDEVLVQHRHRYGITGRLIEDQEIEERCLFAMIEQAAWLINNDIVEHPDDIDLVWLHGYGFPRYKGGLTWHADQIGLKIVLASLQRHDAGGGAALAAFMSRRSSFHPGT